jgi:sulfite exporter TauE/SafE
VSPADLVPYLLLGLAGSLHCVGMCGPIALSFALGRGSAGWIAVAGYVVGKAAMYATLALLAARGVAELGARQPQWMEFGRAAVAWAAGLVMVLVALSGLGWLRTPRWKAFAGFERALRTALRGADELPAPLRGLAFGAANGLLPCGLSWAAIALGAAAPSLALALAGPFLFGLATGPVLAGLALGAGQIPVSWRVRGQRLAAVGLLAYGGYTLVRGSTPLAPEATAKVLPPCCIEPGAEGTEAATSVEGIKVEGTTER